MEKPIRELIKENFGVELPIVKGSGKSVDDPIVIQGCETNNYVGMEHAVLKYLAILRGVNWRLLRQKLIHQKDRYIDEMKIETTRITDTEIVKQIEYHYFDITEFFEKSGNKNMEFDEENTLEQIKNRLLELEQKNDENKKAMALLREGKLCKSEYLYKFMDMLFEDESLALFEDMYNHKKKTVTVVLRIIRKKLRKENK